MRSFPAWIFLVAGLVVGAVAGVAFGRSSFLNGTAAIASHSAPPSPWNSLPFHLTQKSCAGGDCTGPNWIPEDLEAPGAQKSNTWPFTVLSNMSVNGGGSEVPETLPDESPEGKTGQKPTEHYVITIPETAPAPGASPRQQTLFLNGVHSGKTGHKSYLLVTCYGPAPNATPSPCPQITPTPTPAPHT